ncbi:DNA helicase MCM8 [Nematocida sp. LUAm3]|nr:DNA helicase MCM8 [Nematocida sp. LUAm3]KAI5173556.1 DNA helicase MCM8 [Nematocida sp. LUAm2]KAI5176777.1 DNA helicase MCM8 [Nematocida sp. LUAm1]
MDAYKNIYFEEEYEEEVVKKFYGEVMRKVEEKKISVEEIEKGLFLSISEASEYLEEVNGEGVNHLRMAMSMVLHSKKKILKKVPLRLTGFPDPIPYSSVRHTLIGKIFSVVGIVSKIESYKPISEVLVFGCVNCGEEEKMHLRREGAFKRQTKCYACGSKKVFQKKDSKNNVFLDQQRFSLHELSYGADNEKTKQRSIHCILTDTLINTLLPGDIIHLLGVGVAEESEKEKYIISVEVNNYIFLKHRDTSQESTKLLAEEIEQIKVLSQSESLLEKLSESLFYEIVGNRRVKQGVLLSLVGGSVKNSKRRKEIHTLMVGDPGMGKSKLIRIASSVLPRSHYVCGTTSTAGGLGVSIVSKAGGEYALEAGALVLSDLGHCFIDEIDKLDSKECLFEAMEKEEISIAKAGMICTMPCRTALIAAANPLLGKYSEEKTLSENISFPQSFLSRFDQIFIMIDKKEDNLLEITERLLSTSVSAPLIPFSVIKRYIEYARSSIHPVLSESARNLLIEFYGEVKRNGAYMGRAPVQSASPRLIDAVMRICEGVSKIHLRQIATRTDMLCAIDLCTVPEEIKRHPKSKRSVIESLLSLIRNSQQPISYHEIHAVSQPLGISREKVDHLIHLLNNSGDLLKASPSTFTTRNTTP